MSGIVYRFAKLRLVLAGVYVSVAKAHMNRLIRNSRAAKEEIDRRYESFLDRCKKREKAGVMLKRITSRKTEKPLLKVDLGLEHYIVKSELSKKLTRLEAESALTRHRYGDWGEVSLRRWQKNNEKAIRKNGTLCSRYPLFGGNYFLVESNRKSEAALLRLEEKTA